MGKNNGVTELKTVVGNLTSDINKLITSSTIQLEVQKEQNKKIDKLLNHLPDLAVVKNDIEKINNRVEYLEDSLVKSGKIAKIDYMDDQIKSTKGTVTKAILVVFTAIVGAVGTLIVER